MDAGNREAIAAALVAASGLRAAAALTDPCRRVEAIGEVLGRLRRRPGRAAAIVERLRDDGRGETEIPGRPALMTSARELEEMAATAWGVGGRRGPDPGRVRSHALRADGPTTTAHRRRPRRRRRAGRRRR